MTETVEPQTTSKAAAKLLNDFKTLTLTPDDATRKEIESYVSDDELAREFMALRMDREVNPKELKKMNFFGGALFKQIDLDVVWATMSLYSIGHCRSVLEHVAQLRAGKDQDGTPLERVLSEEGLLGALRLGLLGSVEMSRMIARAQKVAQSVQEPKVKTGPKNRPPNSLAPPPVMVQNNGGQVVVHAPPTT